MTTRTEKTPQWRGQTERKARPVEGKGGGLRARPVWRDAVRASGGAVRSGEETATSRWRLFDWTGTGSSCSQRGIPSLHPCLIGTLQEGGVLFAWEGYSGQPNLARPESQISLPLFDSLLTKIPFKKQTQLIPVVGSSRSKYTTHFCVYGILPCIWLNCRPVRRLTNVKYSLQ